MTLSLISLHLPSIPVISHPTVRDRNTFYVQLCMVKSNMFSDHLLDSRSMLDYSACFYFVFVKSDVEDTLKRIQSHRGVTGVIIADQQGKSCFFFVPSESFVYCRVPARRGL